MHLNKCSHTLKTCGYHFAEIIEPLSYFSFRDVSAMVINDKGQMHSFLHVHLKYSRSPPTQKLKVNILCSHFVWSPENHAYNLVSRFRYGQKAGSKKPYACQPVPVVSNSACELSRALATSLDPVIILPNIIKYRSFVTTKTKKTEGV